jgi:Tol biopolymer transport system component
MITACILFIANTGAAQSNYDIYVFDVKAQTTKRLTGAFNASEWNVSWSNNGKKIAYDVVGSPSAPYDQSVFITDLQAGTSTPLTGAEGGNDAAWSPDGEKIAFDDWHLYPYSIYSVPANGGARSILRYNAHHASWNPKSDKIAFDDNYGYIGTKDINTGFETFVTWYGDRPSWSPNGQYIAFDGWSWIGGGVWVVKVDSLGNPQGWPIQLTTSGYGPTWKNNSKEIVFIDWPNGDPDLYSVPVSGGTPTRVCGRVSGFDKGDYDPAYSNDGQFIAWSSYTDEPLVQSTEKNKERTQPGLNSFELKQNHPNPFTSETKIDFQITGTSHIIISVYNALGQKIKTLADADYKAGNYSVTWNGKDENNMPLSTGLYLCQLQSGNNVQVKKMNLWR